VLDRPPPQGDGACGGWDSSSVDNGSDGNPFIEQLAEGGYINPVPGDPIGGTTCEGPQYWYYRYGAGSNCDASRGAFYVLGVRDMETSPRPHPASPGWQCGTRNWSNEFDWVVGRYER